MKSVDLEQVATRAFVAMASTGANTIWSTPAGETEPEHK
jgi:hypothetical protein